MTEEELAQIEAPPEEVLDWAVGRWKAEVAERPLRNVHRRSLDDRWRRVIRFVGGNPDELIGPCHDELLAALATKQEPK